MAGSRAEACAEHSVLLLSCSIMSMFGVLLRCLLHWAFQLGPSNYAVYTDLPANLLGCFFMGFLSVLAARIDPPAVVWLRVFVYDGCIKGFCGSLTSFSSWIVATVVSSLQCGPDGYCWSMQCYQLFSTWFSCYACFLAGEHLGALLSSSSSSSSLSEHHHVFLVSALRRDWSAHIAIAVFAFQIGLCILWLVLQPSSVIPASILFAPVGACLRVELGLAAAWRGTVVANSFGVCISSIALLMWRAAGESGSIAVRIDGLSTMAVLAGSLSFGFAGLNFSLCFVRSFIHAKRCSVYGFNTNDGNQENSSFGVWSFALAAYCLFGIADCICNLVF